MVMFSIAGSAPDRTLSVFYSNGDQATVPESHARYAELQDLCLSGAGDDEVRELVDIMLAIANKMSDLSERIAYRKGHITFDGDPVRGELVDIIRDAYEQDHLDFVKPLVNFLEKVYTNPGLRSVDDLYRWISNKELTITEDGDFLAYKGCDVVDGVRYSRSEGTAYVNGVEVSGRIPNLDGSVISMPRSEVDDGGYNHCSTGLHAAVHGFASNFAGYNGEVILIKVNPRDVVSVPYDASSQKLRVCRYTVLHKVEQVLDQFVYAGPAEEPEVFDDASDETMEFETWGTINAEEVVDEASDEISEFVGDDEQIDEGFAPEAPEEVTAPAGPVRDAFGRFTKDSVARAIRDEKGRFRGFAG